MEDLLKIQDNGQDHSIDIGREDLQLVKIALVQAAFAKAKVTRLAGHVGSYKSDLTKKIAEKVLEFTHPCDNSLFYIDYAYGKEVKVGCVYRDDGSVMLVDRSGRCLEFKKASKIVEGANYYLEFLKFELQKEKEDKGDVN